VRIGRAASGKDKVAFCGYHGWHDWYLAANLSSDDSLTGHLLPGLEPNGVPKALTGTSIPFQFNDLDQLTKIMTNDDQIGVIYMEVQRSDPPAEGFLEGVRALATQHNAVLIFDECTSGFRRELGGMHLHYGVEPDLASFGKTLGNGYAITAIIGRAEVMQAAQTSFISSTFWTERIGPTAALATLKVMEKEGAAQRVHEIGINVQQQWEKLGADAGLTVTTGGLPALANFAVAGLDPLAVKTYITSRMLDQGYLSGNSLYVAIAHTDAILDQYYEALAIVFTELAQMDDAQLVSALPNGTAQAGFKRLT
jgi:glutamate-1-semialdehyde 2,1-aminomutase